MVGKVRKVRRLISEGVDINGVHSRYGCTGLIVGMLHGNTDIVRTLLECSNIKIDIKDSYGWTALHCAANNNKVESVELFLAHPACNKDIVKMKNNDGMTAEMMAEEEGNQECARLVREYLENNDSEADEKDEQPNNQGNLTDDEIRDEEIQAKEKLIKTTMNAKRKATRKWKLRTRRPIYQCTNNSRKSLLILLLLLLVPVLSLFLQHL